jgi:transcriptional regulator with XRE-family HTH domain
MSASPAFQVALGLAVKARRSELELTQEQLANDTELHQRWISNVETGKRNPSYASLRRLAAGLELPTADLIARAEQLEPDVISPTSQSSQRPATDSSRLCGVAPHLDPSGHTALACPAPISPSGPGTAGTVPRPGHKER